MACECHAWCAEILRPTLPVQGVLHVQPAVMLHTAPESPTETPGTTMPPVYIWTQANTSIPPFLIHLL